MVGIVVVVVRVRKYAVGIIELPVVVQLL